jgi:DNA repair protein RecN (Recombination protein N)
VRDVIEELHIRGLGVIEHASLRLAPGLTVVTGETGAGKTMLVTALELLLGARADASLVRRGAAAAIAEAVVSPPPPEAADWLGEGDDELVVSREIPAEGRSRARLGGRLAPVSALADVLGRHVEVHAQHEHVRLARPDVQRALLDRYAGDPHARTLAAYREVHAAWRELVRRRERLDADARERARELDRLRFELGEIDAAQLDAEADDDLERELELLAHAEEVQLAAEQVAAALGSDGAQEPLGVAVDVLRRLDVDDASLDDLRARSVALAAEAAELAADVRSFGESTEADPERLAGLQERQALVRQLARKYGADVPAVLAYADEARARLTELEHEEADAGELDTRLAAQRARLEELAEDVRRGRRAAAERLAEVVDGHLVDLAMPHGRFSVAVDPLEDGELTADGADRVRFLLAPNPGEPPRPLGQAASGGERSRVSLAVEVALADVDDADVLVFDEVDAGIGGATAMAVGEKLARLAAGAAGRPRQVLCVTHLAQLAAFADVHHVVEKGLRDGRTVTTTRQVADDDRVPELSRMLGGDPTATAGLEHARELLEVARERRVS